MSASPAKAVTGSHTVGVSDNKPSTFYDPRLKQIGIRTARVILPWNAISRDPKTVADWLNHAKVAGIQPLVAFDRTRGNNCPARPCYLPTVKQYKREFTKFHKKYKWVKYVSPWNESNHPGQPTAKNPSRVADYHHAILEVCRKCKVVAGDPLDTQGVGGWMKSYEKRLRIKHHRKVSIWGLHNYISANYFSTAGTREALRATKADVWLTETGGIVQMLTYDETRLNYDEARAARALAFALDLMSKYPCRVKRIYVYNWQAAPKDRFDTGVINPDGRARPAFDVLSGALQASSPVQQGTARCAQLRAKSKGRAK
ncbi:MAG: hypothetical protein JHC95_02690 [Solirubrobacteraceae bacterium]|nr:hypothetical protein [Solirubrobacteraceae bacterium]